MSPRRMPHIGRARLSSGYETSVLLLRNLRCWSWWEMWRIRTSMQRRTSLRIKWSIHASASRLRAQGNLPNARTEMLREMPHAMLEDVPQDMQHEMWRIKQCYIACHRICNMKCDEWSNSFRSENEEGNDDDDDDDDDDDRVDFGKRRNFFLCIRSLLADFTRVFLNKTGLFTIFSCVMLPATLRSWTNSRCGDGQTFA